MIQGTFLHQGLLEDQGSVLRGKPWMPGSRTSPAGGSFAQAGWAGDVRGQPQVLHSFRIANKKTCTEYYNKNHSNNHND